MDKISLEDLIQENLSHHKGMIANAKKNLEKFHSTAIKVYPLLKELGFSEDITIDTILEEFDFDSPNSALIELINVLSETKMIEESSYWVDGDRVYKEGKEARSNSVEFEIESIKGDSPIDIIWAKYMGWNIDGTCKQEIKDEVAKIAKIFTRPTLWVSNQGFFSRHHCDIISWSKLNY